PTRRAALSSGAATALSPALAEEKHRAAKVYRIGVVSASIRGKPQPRNGHTWHFAQYLHPTVDLDAIKKYLDPGSADSFRKVVRNPRYDFDQLPFADTKITHYYDADAKVIGPYTEAFPDVKAAKSVEDVVEEVDAVAGRRVGLRRGSFRPRGAGAEEGPA